MAGKGRLWPIRLQPQSLARFHFTDAATQQRLPISVGLQRLVLMLPCLGVCRPALLISCLFRPSSTAQCKTRVAERCRPAFPFVSDNSQFIKQLHLHCATPAPARRTKNNICVHSGIKRGHLLHACNPPHCPSFARAGCCTPLFKTLGFVNQNLSCKNSKIC